MRKFKINMSDYIIDKNIIKIIDANDIFEAINIATTIIGHPEQTKLIEAIPIFEEIN